MTEPRIVTTISDKPSPVEPHAHCGEVPDVHHLKATFACPEGYAVSCGICGMQGQPDDSPTGAVENWNAKTPVLDAGPLVDEEADVNPLAGA